MKAGPGVSSFAVAACDGLLRLDDLVRLGLVVSVVAGDDGVIFAKSAFGFAVVFFRVDFAVADFAGSGAVLGLDATSPEVFGLEAIWDDDFAGGSADLVIGRDGVRRTA